MASMARYLGRMVIGSVIPMGWSSRRIINYLGRVSGTYRRTDMLRDIREFRDLHTFGASVQELAVNVRPPTAIMVETELTRPRKYRVFGRAKYVDRETGHTTYKNVSFYDDTLRTKEQWAEEFTRQKEEGAYRVGDSVEEMDIYAIEHNEGVPY